MADAGEQVTIDALGIGETIAPDERWVHAAAPGRRSCVLVVEDPTERGPLLGPLLERAGFAVRECADRISGFDAFIRELPDLIVARDRLEGLDGLELVRRVREISDVPVVLVSAADSPWIRERALRLGADRFVAEPAELDSLPDLALDLAEPARPRRLRPRVTAAHVRRVARSELRAELERLLIECRGNLAEMARRMGRDRSTIRYHLRRFGMLAEESATWSSRSEHALARNGSRKTARDASASA